MSAPQPVQAGAPPATVDAGSWVELQRELIPAGSRSSVPQDTADRPLVMRVRGFLLKPAAPGDAAEVRTLAGRVLRGTLRDPAPCHTHGFGRPEPTLLPIGPAIRARLGTR